MSKSQTPQQRQPLKKKLDAKTVRVRFQRGIETISNIISRVNLSRTKIIWDVLEEIRFSQISVKERKSLTALENTEGHSVVALNKSSDCKLSPYNSKTETSAELEQQVIDKTDLDYYYIERLEKMRDLGIREEDYSLIEQEEKFSLEKADTSEEEDLGYVSDSEDQYSGNHSYSQDSERKVRQSVHTGNKNLGNGDFAEYEEEEQVYF